MFSLLHSISMYLLSLQTTIFKLKKYCLSSSDFICFTSFINSFQWHTPWGSQGAGHAPNHTHTHTHFNFRTEQDPNFSVSNLRDIVFYKCSEIIRTRNFPIFIVYITIFGQLIFIFSKYIGEIENFTLDCWRGPILNARR